MGDNELLKLILSEMRGLRTEMHDMQKTIATLEAQFGSVDFRELERRIDALEADKARRAGMAAATGIAGGGAIVAIIEVVSSLL